MSPGGTSIPDTSGSITSHEMAADEFHRLRRPGRFSLICPIIIFIDNQARKINI